MYYLGTFVLHKNAEFSMQYISFHVMPVNAEGSPHAPEKPVPPPTIGFRININGLIQGPEVKLSLVVGRQGDTDVHVHFEVAWFFPPLFSRPACCWEGEGGA